jgi:hypothetical protein
MRNEKTSKRVAAIAGRVLRALAECRGYDVYCVVSLVNSAEDGEELRRVCSRAELKAIAASVLTQAEDKPKRKKGARPPA